MAMKTVPVPPEADGMPLDTFIRRLLPDLPESAFHALYAARDIKMDGVRISRDAVIHSGQVLQIYLQNRWDPESMPLRIVYEDDDVLLVNKPAGISVEPSGAASLSLSEKCRMHVMQDHPDSFPPTACHRLDVRTSGLCLFAKNDRALEILQQAFRQRTIEKYYECLVRGVMKPPAAICHAYLAKDAVRARVRVTDHPVSGAVPITTGYETLLSGPVSRLRVHLITGRTHQIRAHLAALGHPVLGDDVYGDRDFNRSQRARALKLCAVSIRLFTSGKLPQLDNREFSITPPF